MNPKINIHSWQESEKYKTFLPLLLEHKEKVYGYILTLVPRPNIADDIMQETVLVMWEKFHDFQIGTNFYAWSKSIAFNKIRNYRKTVKRSPMLFNDEVINRLSDETGCIEDDNLRIEKLKACLKALSKIEAKLVELRFVDNAAIKNIAKNWGKTPQFLYRQMSKILVKLRECIRIKPVELEY